MMSAFSLAAAMRTIMLFGERRLLFVVMIERLHGDKESVV